VERRPCGLAAPAGDCERDDPNALLFTDGVMEFKTKGEISAAPPGHLAWFEVPGRLSATDVMVIGHWSALGLKVEPRLLALDSGCFWGRHLSAVRLEDRAVFQVDCATGEGHC
jgi:bis(5'-nucleosyl)-tetraphosphatase (symmetrical)